MLLWYLGDNRLTQDPEDFITELPIVAPGFTLPDSSVAERTQYLTLSVRDHLNAGGKLIHAGETTGYFGLLNDLLGGVIGGIYYGLDDFPEEECVVEDDFFSDCLLLANDFTQYYLGAWSRDVITGAEGIVGTSGPMEGDEALFGGPATVDNPIDEAGAFTLTSELLPPDEFPQFAGSAVIDYLEAAGTITAIEGEFAVAANHADESYMRLGRTFDLTSINASEMPTFEAQMAWSTEEGYDHVIVEAHTLGQDNWTTLPDLNGATTTAVPTDCEQEYYIGLHPNLLKYLTQGDPCTTPGSATPGLWNSFTGESDGWQPVAFDLSAYAGQQVEVIVSYVTDPVTGGSGVIIDGTG